MSGKVVLWISRHRPLPAQLQYLEERLGNFELIQYDKPLATAEDAIKLAKEYKADYIVPVLPITFIMHLVTQAKREGFVVLRAEMENLHNCESDNCPDFDPETDTIMVSKDLNSDKIVRRHFRFKGFTVLKDIQIVTEPF